MKVAFIIPFHNEENNVIPMIEQVAKYCRGKKWDFELIPVDDRSTDNTRKHLRYLSKKYHFVKPLYRNDSRNSEGNTMGIALIEGTGKTNADYIIWTMGDLADKPETYGEIIDKLHGGSDMVFGSRYMPGGSRGNLDVLKAFLSSWGTLLARFLFQVPVHDITNAFRGFKKDVFRKIRLDSSGFSISPEFAIKAHLAGFKIGEVPTVYTNRVEGISSFKLYHMTISYLNLYFSLFYKYKLLRQPPDFLRHKSVKAD